MNRITLHLSKTYVVLAVMMAASLTPLQAATRTWTGTGGDAKWSTPENWGGTAPAGGEVLVFDGTTSLANTNDLPSLGIAGLRFQSGGFQLYGNPLIMTTAAAGLVTNLAGLNTIYFNINSLPRNEVWYIASGAELVLANTNTSAATGNSGGVIMLDGGGSVRITGSLTSIRGMDLTNGTVIVDGGYCDHSNDGIRFKPRAGATASARIINNGTWRVGGGGNLRMGNTSAAGTNRMSLESGTLELYGSTVSIYVGDKAVAGSSTVFTQTGGQVLSTGSGATDLYLGTASGAECIYNLDGGTLMVRRIQANSGSQGIFNFNGGTLLAKTSDATFLEGIAAANIKAGGAIIDSSSFTVTIGQALMADAASPGGGLTKLGTGTVNLNGFNSYQGATKVGSGTLGLVAANYPSGSSLFVSNSAAISLAATGGFSSMDVPGVTLDDNTTLSCSYGTLTGNPTVPAITRAATSGTALNARGTNITVNISGAGFVTGQFPIIKYSGALGGNGYGAFVLGTLPPGVLGRLVNNTLNNSIDLNITLVVNALTWNGNVNADWDLNTTANWKDPMLVAATYKEYGMTDIVGDTVAFDDSLYNDFINPPRTNINLAATVRPAIIIFSGLYTPYSLGGSGKLSGSGVMNISGSGSLKISTANDYSGGTTMASGTTQTLLLGNDAALGTGPVTLNGGTISADGATARTITNAATITAATFGANTAAGSLTFSGPVNYGGASRVLTVNSTVVLSGTVASGGVERKPGPGTWTYNGATGKETSGNWQIEDGQILVTGSSLEKGNGGIRIMAVNAGGLSRFTLSGGVLTMSGTGQNIRVGSANPAGDPTATNIANIAGTLTWTTNNPGGQMQMGTNCAFAQLNLLAGGLLRMGAFLPQGAGNMEVNLDGGTLAPMASRTDFMQGLTWANVRNGGLTVDTEGLNITIAQSLLAAGSGGLTKNGLGTLTLTGANTYTGATLVSAGTLVLGKAHAAPGHVTVADGAQLGFLSDGPGVTVSLRSATLGSATGAGLLAQFTGISGNPTAPAAHITDLTLNGSTPISLSLGGVQLGTIPLVRYTTLNGAGSFTVGDLPQGVVGTISTNVATSTIELAVSSVTPLVWSGAFSGTWDVGISTNWVLGSAGTAFQDGDNVRLDDSALGSAILITQPVSPGSVQVSNNAIGYILATGGTGKISGATGIGKDGTNFLALGGANNFTGDVVIRNGILELNNASALGSTSGGTYVSNGATLNMKDIRLAATVERIYITGQGFNNLGALYSDTGNGNADFLRDLRLTGDAWVGAAAGARFGYSDVAGTITCEGGTYKLTKVGAGQFDLEEATVTVGDIEVKEGTLQVANATKINSGHGISLQDGTEFRINQLDAALNRPFTFNGGRINVTGGAGAQNQLTSEVTINTAGTFQVGSGYVLTAVNVVKGAGGLFKTGAGVLALGAANTYTGSTVISNGTVSLASGASIAASPTIFVNTGGTLDVTGVSPWTLAASQTLSGSGTINGSVTASGTISPGASIGALTFNNDLTLGGTAILEVTRDGGLTNDIVSVNGMLTYGGVLKVVVSGSTSLSVNDTFKLFNFVSTPAGGFSQVQLPSGYNWDVTQLPVDGTVRVTGVTAPPTLVVTQIGNSLQFTWIGPYKLQAQTNSLSVGLGSNWFDYPGDGASGVMVPIDPANGTVYFRLYAP